MSDFVGVFGLPDLAGALRRAGHPVGWTDGEVAFSGAEAWVSPDGNLVVTGEAVLDPHEATPGDLACPRKSPLEHFGGLYLRFGSQAARYALGMFALAVWDRKSRELHLFRDATGARTLYHARRGGECWFSTRLRGLRRSPLVSGELSLPALRAYLTLAYVPGELTLWKDARELRPGTQMTLPTGTITTYWEPEEKETAAGETLESCAQGLRPLLEECVRVRLPAEGPVGIYLSGGLDSSLVVALAARLHQGPVHTYAIHFGNEYPNELAFSGMVARHCGTRHQVLELPARLIRDTLAETLAELDDPIGDPLTVPNYLLGRAARKDVEVVLNGEGGDPLFGGPKNLPMLLHELYGDSGAAREPAYLRAYQKCYDDLPALLTEPVRKELAGEPPLEAMVQPFLRDPHTRHYLNRLMRINTCLKGADHILTKVGNLTSVHGLVGRSPLFDRRLVEAAFAIPPEYKLSAAEEKAVLKRAVADLLPQEILTRPKSGMLVPVQAWFKRDFKRYAASRLLGRGSRIRPYLNQDLIRTWLRYQGNLWPRHGVKLWLVLTLEEWLRVNQ